MPGCEKTINIFKGYHSEEIALTLRCCQSLNHTGDHEFHMWTDGKNELNESGKGIIKIINEK